MNKEYAKLIETAEVKGYTVKATFVECPGCKAEIEAHMTAKGLSERPIYMRATTGVRFTKKGCPDIIACPDGHRHITQPTTFKEPTTCRTEGCNVKIGQKQLEENDGYCWKCKPPQTNGTTKHTVITNQPVKSNKAMSKAKSNMGHAPKTNKVVM